MSKLSPEKDDFKPLIKFDKEKPVFMLNLVKFKDGRKGQVLYMKYQKAMQPLLEANNAKLFFMGKTVANLVSAAKWDLGFIVQYPDKKTFLKMVASEEYAKVSHMREEALSDAELIALDSLPLS